MIKYSPCDTKRLRHTALLPVQLVHLMEHAVLLHYYKACVVAIHDRLNLPQDSLLAAKWAKMGSL